MNYTAIDFETANCDRASICAVGIVRVENGSVAEKIYSLVNPHAHFDYWNMRIHNITPRDVESAPSFAALWPSISRFFADNVVAHNAPFDVSCLKGTAAMYGLDMPDFDYFCTLGISRRALCLPSNKLDCVARHFNLPAFRHHNALADAMACALIFRRFEETLNIEPFRRRLGCGCGAPAPRGFSASAPKFRSMGGAPEAQNAPAQTRKIRLEILPAQTRGALFSAAKMPQGNRAKMEPEYDNPPVDFSKKFKIAGRFGGDMTPRQIESLIMRAGGSVAGTMDEFPDYLVLGSRGLNAGRGELCDDYYIAKKSRVPVLSEKYFFAQIAD